jgi:maleate isomerase
MTVNLPPLPAPNFRFGALVPPANPTVEIEYPALLPADVAFHAMRLPVLPGDLDARNKGYVESYPEMVKGFGSLKLDAIAIALTGSQYRLTPKGDIDLCNRLSDQAGIRVETATIAIDRALKLLGIEAVSLMSPYPNYQTQLAIAYWQEAGYRVHSVSQFEDDLVAYRVTPDEIAGALKKIDADPNGAIILSGTGMRTLDMLSANAAQIGVPVLASNICSVWSLTNKWGAASPWMAEVAPPALLHPEA